ncbi:MAG: hypothetical protein COU06_00055 [Candidatus Harrisonbacteria bacterium CG10_big_fil_rev_8_21_14_0_10_38_8]|uniref:RNA polymerase sigma-70 domain-containing protein n=1 Tax=Candidatus Harrisonbacteria bacterium CG10_big_fil_rev_8_21_14_0_10_38_8 TaxID=1974582 RepID=A0A2M6WKW5_9BACT|nr:MAG: hypothetical protein COU06_00055 [Candidatus Harrisonbacteria bacterium CG10_big_fil_rev_8_21_14_0_10_38_8]
MKEGYKEDKEIDINSVWKRYLDGTGDKKEDEGLLFEANKGLIKRIANRYAKKVPPTSGSTYDDIYSAGSLGLLEAIRGFDPSKGFAFSTYAYKKILSSILDYLRSTDKVSRDTRRFAKLWKNTISELSSNRNDGLSVTDDEVIKRLRELGYSDKEITSIKKSYVVAHRASVNGDNKGVTDLLPGREETPISNAIKAEQRENLDNILIRAGLSEILRESFILYYIDGLTLKAIALKYNVNESAIFLRIKRGLKKLKKHVENQGLSLDDYI